MSRWHLVFPAGAHWAPKGYRYIYAPGRWSPEANLSKPKGAELNRRKKEVCPNSGSNGRRMHASVATTPGSKGICLRLSSSHVSKGPLDASSPGRGPPAQPSRQSADQFCPTLVPSARGSPPSAAQSRQTSSKVPTKTPPPNQKSQMDIVKKDVSSEGDTLKVGSMAIVKSERTIRMAISFHLGVVLLLALGSPSHNG